MKKLKVKPTVDGSIVFGKGSFGIVSEKVVDYRTSEIGRQNWEVCGRMLVHDLLDLSEKNPELKKILDYYSIRYMRDGGYSMALPRHNVVNRKETK